MSSHRQKYSPAGSMLRYPCPLAELEDVLRRVDLGLVREHIDRLRLQLALAERILAERDEAISAKQQAETSRLEALFTSMSVPDLEKYISSKRPNSRLAKRILNHRIAAHQRQIQSAAAMDEMFWNMSMNDLKDYVQFKRHGWERAASVLGEKQSLHATFEGMSTDCLESYANDRKPEWRVAQQMLMHRRWAQKTKNCPQPKHSSIKDAETNRSQCNRDRRRSFQNNVGGDWWREQGE